MKEKGDVRTNASMTRKGGALPKMNPEGISCEVKTTAKSSFHGIEKQNMGRAKANEEARLKPTK